MYKEIRAADWQPQSGATNYLQTFSFVQSIILFHLNNEKFDFIKTISKRGKPEFAPWSIVHRSGFYKMESTVDGTYA